VRSAKVSSNQRVMTGNIAVENVGGLRIKCSPSQENVKYVKAPSSQRLKTKFIVVVLVGKI